MPMSIMPERMALAMSAHACRPEEHCLLRDLTAVDSGKPATRAAARNSVAPPPGARTQPTATSSTSEGSMWDREMTDFRAWTSRSAPAVSLRRPFPPRVKGVRRAHVTTMSSPDFRSIDSRPRGISTSEDFRCEATCERRA